MLFGVHFFPFDLDRVDKELLRQGELEAFNMAYDELTSFRILLTGRILAIIENQSQADQEIIAQLIEVIAVFVSFFQIWLFENDEKKLRQAAALSDEANVWLNGEADGQKMCLQNT